MRAYMYAPCHLCSMSPMPTPSHPPPIQLNVTHIYPCNSTSQHSCLTACACMHCMPSACMRCPMLWPRYRLGVGYGTGCCHLHASDQLHAPDKLHQASSNIASSNMAGRQASNQAARGTGAHVHALIPGPNRPCSPSLNRPGISAPAHQHQHTGSNQAAGTSNHKHRQRGQRISLMPCFSLP